MASAQCSPKHKARACRAEGLLGRAGDGVLVLLVDYDERLLGIQVIAMLVHLVRLLAKVFCPTQDPNPRAQAGFAGTESTLLLQP